MDICQTIKGLQSLSDVEIDKPSGLPRVVENQCLPDDLQLFYEKFGGVTLFPHAENTYRIVQPQEFKLANPILIADEELLELELNRGNTQLLFTSECYVLVDLGDANYIVIDLNKERHGLCYLGFWDSFGVIGETPIIAKSFKELLQKMIESEGEEVWFFEKEDFQDYGDAFIVAGVEEFDPDNID
ncbi:SMI1/KNR4 family protein [Laceyella putida]|uniref:SMI1/KNR4 family protein n=1 Tax=Laceyella putida TaxID=110101 RepID=A0ABW2RQI0_9BACL